MLTSWVYFTTHLRTKVSVPLWSIPFQNTLNYLTVSQIHRNPSSTKYLQGPPQAHQTGRQLLHLHPCAWVPHLRSFLLQEGENTKKQTPASEEAAVEVKLPLTLYKKNNLHPYTQLAYNQLVTTTGSSCVV